MASMTSEILKKWLDEIAAQYRSIAPKASGNTANNTIVETDESGGRILVPYYNYWLVNGRGKNKDQSKEAITHFTRWAGYYLFTPWVKQKGISISPYVVAWKVAKEGYPQKIKMSDVVTDAKKTELNKSIGNLYAVQINSLWRQ